jgi:hypothetical protein
LIRITKDEKNWLLDHGFKFGSTLHRTVKNRSYYMTESEKAMQCLNEYRNKATIND